jgi:hypothetical protein
MFKKNILYIFIFVVCCTAELNYQKTVSTVFIDSAYVDKWHTIYFDTQNSKRQLFLHNDSNVFTIVDHTKWWGWILVSVMPSNPDEAYGMNEEFKLFYVPMKKEFSNQDLNIKDNCSYVAFVKKDNEDCIVVMITSSIKNKMDTLKLSSLLRTQ